MEVFNVSIQLCLCLIFNLVYPVSTCLSIHLIAMRATGLIFLIPLIKLSDITGLCYVDRLIE